MGKSPTTPVQAAAAKNAKNAKNATMAGDPTKINSETQIRYPDKELLSQVKIWVMVKEVKHCKELRESV